jgi:hypothetical protein
MWSIPGTYSIHRTSSRRQSTRLTSVKAAKELALKKHGSIEALEKAVPFNSLDIPFWKIDLWTWFRNAPLHMHVEDVCAVEGAISIPTDIYEGMGTVHFPSIIDGKVEQGLWCQGCKDAFEKYLDDDLDFDTLAGLVPQGCDPERYLTRIQPRAYSKSGLIQHAKLCHSDVVDVP